MCGFNCHGPRGEIEFAPRLTPERFKAPFVGAEGWGTFQQRVVDGVLTASLDISYGRLDLKTLRLTLPTGLEVSRVAARVNGQQTRASLICEGQSVFVQWAEMLPMESGQQLEVTLSS